MPRLQEKSVMYILTLKKCISHIKLLMMSVLKNLAYAAA